MAQLTLNLRSVLSSIKGGVLIIEVDCMNKRATHLTIGAYRKATSTIQDACIYYNHLVPARRQILVILPLLP